MGAKKSFQNQKLRSLRIVIVAMMMELIFSILELCLGLINICYIG